MSCRKRRWVAAFCDELLAFATDAHQLRQRELVRSNAELVRPFRGPARGPSNTGDKLRSSEVSRASSASSPCSTASPSGSWALPGAPRHGGDDGPQLPVDSLRVRKGSRYIGLEDNSDRAALELGCVGIRLCLGVVEGVLRPKVIRGVTNRLAGSLHILDARAG
jgi:hypothetical protein